MDSKRIPGHLANLTLHIGDNNARGLGSNPVCEGVGVRFPQRFPSWSAEEGAATFINDKVCKPVVAFIAGQTAPPGKLMGHAGAIISGCSGKATDKLAPLYAAGLSVTSTIAELGQTVKMVTEY